MKWKILAVVGVSALGFVLGAAVAMAHTAPTITRNCDSVTVHNTGSNGTLTILQQTGGVFTVGQTVVSGGELTKPAAPNQSGTIVVDYSTDHNHFTASWGKVDGCTPPTPPTTKPTTTTITEKTTTTTGQATTTTASTPGVSLIPPSSEVAPPVAATPQFTG